MVVDLTRQLDKTNRLVQQLIAARSGARSEQLSVDQLRLFAQEAGLPAEAEKAEEQTDTDRNQDPPSAAGASTNEGSKPRGRQPLPRHLKRERILHDLPDADKHCATCQTDLRHIGEDVSERYEYLPARMMVIEEVCRKYACDCTIRTASKPPQPIEKSTASASVLAQVIVAKVADHLPVHRQAKMFRRFGVELSDQTMCGWLRQSAELLVPLYEGMKAFVLKSKVVGTDDTPVKVLDRSLPHARKGRFWPYLGDKEHPAIVYDYTPTRERAGPERFLANYRGYLQLDAYPAYDKFFADHKRGLVEVGCWAHARRHVFNARETDPSRMGAVLAYIARLYAVEKHARRCALSSEPLRLLRETAARPAMQELHAYLIRIEPELLPKSDAGQAVAYILKNWFALTRYLTDADLPIDNNRTERAIRGIAVGRHNWTFLGSDRGGKTMAILRSFVSSCELNAVDPFAWFHDVLSRIASHSIHRLEQLFPHRWRPLAAE